MSWIMRDWRCERCGQVVEVLAQRGAEPPWVDCACGGSCAPVISAVRGRVKLGEVTRGRSEPPPPNVVDTRPLAEGMSLNDWKAMRSKQRLDKLRSKLRE